MNKRLLCIGLLTVLACSSQTPSAATQAATTQGFQPNCEGRNTVVSATQAIKQNPRDKADLAALFACRGEAYEVAGEANKAIPDYTQAIQLAPRNPWHYRARGLVYLAFNDYARAIADLGQAVRLAQTDIPIQVTAYVGRATAYYAQKRYDLGIRDATQVIKLSASNAEAYRLRALCLREKGKFDLALADFAKSIELDPNNPRTFANRARLHATRGQFDFAVSDWNDSLRLKPLAESFYYRGSAYIELKKYDLAIADLTQATTLAPPYIDAVRLRGQALAFKGDYAAAIADLNQYIGTGTSGDAFAYFLRGLSHSRLDQRDEAISDLQQAVKLTTDAELQKKAKEELAKLEV